MLDHCFMLFAIEAASAKDPSLAKHQCWQMHTYSTLGVNADGCFAINWSTAEREGWNRLSRTSSDDLYDVLPCIAPAVLCKIQNNTLEHTSTLFLKQ